MEIQIIRLYFVMIYMGEKLAIFIKILKGDPLDLRPQVTGKV
jgi:hypothetical protein